MACHSFQSVAPDSGLLKRLERRMTNKAKAKAAEKGLDVLKRIAISPDDLYRAHVLPMCRNAIYAVRAEDHHPDRPAPSEARHRGRVMKKTGPRAAGTGEGIANSQPAVSI